MAAPSKPSIISVNFYYVDGLRQGDAGGSASLNAVVYAPGSTWAMLYIRRSPEKPFEYVGASRTGFGAGANSDRAIFSKYFQLLESPSAEFKCVAYSSETEASEESDIFTATVDDILPLPKTPINLSAVQQSGNLVKVSWNEVTYNTIAVGILRGEDEFGDDAIMIGYANGENKNFDTLDNFFVDPTCEYGKTYYYWVWAEGIKIGYFSNQTADICSVTLSDAPPMPPVPPAPTNLRVGA